MLIYKRTAGAQTKPKVERITSGLEDTRRERCIGMERDGA